MPWPIGRELSFGKCSDDLRCRPEDKDGDGTVSAEELKDVLQHVNPKFTEAWGRDWHERTV